MVTAKAKKDKSISEGQDLHKNEEFKPLHRKYLFANE